MIFHFKLFLVYFFSSCLRLKKKNEFNKNITIKQKMKYTFKNLFNS